jgi:hypothetical protein
LTDELFNHEQYYRLMSMVYNLYYCRKRLARRVIRLRRVLGDAQPAVRDLVVREGAELLAGRVNADQVAMQTWQHPDQAVRAASAFEFMFGA